MLAAVPTKHLLIYTTTAIPGGEEQILRALLEIVANPEIEGIMSHSVLVLIGGKWEEHSRLDIRYVE